MPYRISRKAYADMFGPTVGDRMRLADTGLIVQVERDFTIYGEEVQFGGGKVCCAMGDMHFCTKPSACAGEILP